MFVKLQRVLANIPKKYKNLILEGIYLLFTANVWKEILKGQISKILLGIICYYSLIIFG
jgi:hypothetical protein